MTKSGEGLPSGGEGGATLGRYGNARRGLFLRDRLLVRHQRQKAAKDEHECDGGEVMDN